MDRTIPGSRMPQPTAFFKENSSAFSSSLKDKRTDATASHTIIDLSPDKEVDKVNQGPRIYSANRARDMAEDRMDRIKEKLNRKLADNAANNLSSEALNKLKAYIAIQTEIRKALDDENSDLRLYPDELAAVKEANACLEKLINGDFDYYETGFSKAFLTLSAGAVSYLLTFCSGTLLANGLDMPWLSPIVISICWALCERFPPMIRATSWPNKHADVTYPEIMRLTERASRDWVRQLSGLHPKYFIRNGKRMTASEARATCSLLDAWLGKVLSDDLMSHTFTLCYIARNVPLRIFAKADFLATPLGKAVSLCTLAFAGMCAGAFAALGLQGFRRCKHKAENPDNYQRGETLVKSREIWAREFELEKKKIALIRAYAAKFGPEERRDLDDAIRLMEADRDKASAKSRLLGSLVYELTCLFQGKSHLGDDDNGEVAGKLSQTIYGFIAKNLCLLPSALFLTFVVTVFASPNFAIAQQLALLIIAPVILIVGFGLRKELELAVCLIAGFLFGIVDVVSHRCGKEDKLRPLTPATPDTDSVTSEGRKIFGAADRMGNGKMPERPDFSTPAQRRAVGIDGDADAAASADTEEISSASDSALERIANKPSKTITSSLARDNRRSSPVSPYLDGRNVTGGQERKQQASSSTSSSEETV
jgi:hypothetical protein